MLFKEERWQGIGVALLERDYSERRSRLRSRLRRPGDAKGDARSGLQGAAAWARRADDQRRRGAYQHRRRGARAPRASRQPFLVELATVPAAPRPLLEEKYSNKNLHEEREESAEKPRIRRSTSTCSTARITRLPSSAPSTWATPWRCRPKARSGNGLGKATSGTGGEKAGDVARRTSGRARADGVVRRAPSHLSEDECDRERSNTSSTSRGMIGLPLLMAPPKNIGDDLFDALTTRAHRHSARPRGDRVQVGDVRKNHWISRRHCLRLRLTYIWNVLNLCSQSRSRFYWATSMNRLPPRHRRWTRGLRWVVRRGRLQYNHLWIPAILWERRRRLDRAILNEGIGAINFRAWGALCYVISISSGLLLLPGVEAVQGTREKYRGAERVLECLRYPLPLFGLLSPSPASPLSPPMIGASEPWIAMLASVRACSSTRLLQTMRGIKFLAFMSSVIVKAFEDVMPFFDHDSQIVLFGVALIIA